VRCLALDVGERRTGVAIGERLARPLGVINRRSKAEDFAAIGRLVREHGAGCLVIGLPLNMDGTEGFQAKRVRRYADRLRTALRDEGLRVELVFWDERLSTERAVEIGGKHQVDAIAAAVILQSYLDRYERTGSCPDQVES